MTGGLRNNESVRQRFSRRHPLDGRTLVLASNDGFVLQKRRPQVLLGESLACLNPHDFGLDFGPLRARLVLLLNTQVLKERISMEWTTPRHEEIDLNCEVSSYANAEL